jgi:hypothetical protein
MAWEGSGLVLVRGTIHAFTWMGWGNPRKFRVRIDGITAEKRIPYLQSTSQKRNPLSEPDLWDLKEVEGAVVYSSVDKETDWLTEVSGLHSRQGDSFFLWLLYSVHTGPAAHPASYSMGKRWRCPCNRPWRPIRLWDVEASTYSRWRWGCQLYAPAPLYPPSPPGRFQVLVSVRCWVDSRAIVRMEGLGQLKNPVTSSGI